MNDFKVSHHTDDSSKSNLDPLVSILILTLFIFVLGLAFQSAVEKMWSRLEEVHIHFNQHIFIRLQEQQERNTWSPCAWLPSCALKPKHNNQAKAQ